MITGHRPVHRDAASQALAATASFRGITVQPLSSAIGNLVDLRGRTYMAYRSALGSAGRDLPADFGRVVEAVVAFADGLIGGASPGAIWNPARRRWEAEPAHAPERRRGRK